jgi:hypothetical protein
MRELRIVGNLLVMADPATSANDARALALKAEIGEVSRVGMRLGRMMLARVCSVRRVNRADKACSASSSFLNRWRR